MSAVASLSQCKGTKKKAKGNGLYRMTEGGVQDDGREEGEEGGVQDDGREEGEEGGESEHWIFFPREEKKFSSPRKGMEGRQEPGECRGWL